MLSLIKQQIPPLPFFNGVNKYITLEKNLISISQLQKLYKKFLLSYPNFSRKNAWYPHLLYFFWVSPLRATQERKSYRPC